MQEISVLPGRIRLRDQILLNNTDLSRYMKSYIDHLAGVRTSTVNPITASILVLYDATKIGVETIKKNIQKALTSTAYKDPAQLRRYDAYNKVLDDRNRAKRRLFVFALIYVLLKLKHALFGKFFLSASVPALQVAAIVTIIGGYPLIKKLYQKITKRIPADSDVLLSVAAIALTLMRESTKGVLLLLLKALTDYIKYSADASCQKLLGQSRYETAEMAWLVGPAKEESLVPIEALKPHDTVVVHTGELVPAEGRVLKGGALVDMLQYSGQAVYSRMGKGLKVYEGMPVVSGELHVEVVRAPEKQVLPSIQSGELELKQKVSQYQRWITPVALGAGALSMVWGGGFLRMLAVMLALTPSGVSTALSTGMKNYIALLHKHQIYLRKTEAIEKVINADTIAFDKTGTLTEGRLRLRSVHSFDPQYSHGELLRICAACECGHYHPIALTLQDAAGAQQAMAQESTLIPSCGVQATFEHHKIVIGNRLFLKSKGIRMSEQQMEQYSDCERRLYTPVLVGINGKLAGMVVLCEAMKPGAQQMMRRLRHKSNARVALLTGDSQYKAQEIARRLDIGDVYADCSAQHKAEIIRDCRAQGPVMMIGDGINDVQAMRSADLSVSFAHSASDQVKLHSDCLIFDDRLQRLNELISLSEKSYRIINQSIMISKLYSAVFAGLAFFGVIDAFAAKSYNTVNSLLVLVLNKRIEYLSPERHYFGLQESPALPEPCLGDQMTV